MSYKDQLENAHEEREAILGRLRAIFDDMHLSNAPSLTPVVSETTAPMLADAIRTAEETGDTSALLNALTVAESPEGADYSDETTPVAVISLQGLRFLEQHFSELQQLRGTGGGPIG